MAREEREAAREAAGIGGDPGVDDDPAARPVKEGGGGEAEGFELAEEGLRERAEHGGDFRRPTGGDFHAEAEPVRSSAAYGDADGLEPSEPDVAAEDDVSPVRDEPSPAPDR